MNATKLSSDLRQLVTGCVWPGKFDARELPDALRAVAGILGRHGVRYALAGRLALARYSPPQLTDQIELRLGREFSEVEIESELRAALASEIGPRSTIRLSLSRSLSGIEDCFIACALTERWLDVDVTLATREHLLWLAISDDAPESAADAERLLHSGPVNWPALEQIVELRDTAFSVRLAEVRAQAVATAGSTYSSSVEHRLAERARRGVKALSHGR